MPLSIAVIVGSLRRESHNRMLAQALTRLDHAQQHRFQFPQIDDLPLYDQDDDVRQPAPTLRLKEEIRGSDGVIFVTPEYNRSIPGVLKNAIDHASRPYGESAWKGKPAGILGMSTGALGTAMAQQHLRNVLSVLDMPLLTQPEIYLQHREDIFTVEGDLGGKARELCAAWLRAFLKHVELHRAKQD